VFEDHFASQPNALLDIFGGKRFVKTGARVGGGIDLDSALAAPSLASAGEIHEDPLFYEKIP
jgi:hypothetical protein